MNPHRKYLAQLLCLFLSTLIFDQQEASAVKHLLLDTDLGLGMKLTGGRHIPSDIDDTFAIAEAAKSSKFKLLGITTVFGNTDIESVQRAFAKLRPYIAKLPFDVVKGSTGPTGEGLACPDGAAFAADYIAEKLGNHDHVSIAALGPVTNIACLIKRHPDSIKKIDKIMIVMGQSPETLFEINHVPISDFNFISDPNATQVLIDSKIPLVLFPFELTRGSLISMLNLKKKAEVSQLAAHTLREGLPFITMWQTVFQEPGIHPWDSAPIAYMSTNHLFDCEYRSLVVTEKPRLKLLAKRSHDPLTNKHIFCHSFLSEGHRKTFEKNIIGFL